jgi:uncharacterized protein GlcG (DUF336 family)
MSAFLSATCASAQEADLDRLAVGGGREGEADDVEVVGAVGVGGDSASGRLDELRRR